MNHELCLSSLQVHTCNSLPASLLASHLVSQPASQPVSKPASQQASQSAAQSASRSASQPVSQPASRSASQPANQPARTDPLPLNQPGSYYVHRGRTTVQIVIMSTCRLKEHYAYPQPTHTLGPELVGWISHKIIPA